MKRFLFYILLFILFWITVFTIQLLVFLGINYASIQFSWKELLHNIMIALPMNMATACYFLLIPLLFLFFSHFINLEKWINRWMPKYLLTLIIISTFIAAIDAALFLVWGTKLNSRALSYLNYPKEVVPSLFTLTNFGFITVIILEIIAFYKLSKWMIPPYAQPQSNRIPKIGSILVLLPLSVWGIRGGGLENVPINRNWVFYSNHYILNYAALNGVWNLADLLGKPLESDENPYTFFNPEKAENLLKQIHHVENGTFDTILKTKNPNIVFVFLESWSTDVMECLGGEKGVTPQFGALAKEGILFTKCYATGFRTEQGMLSVLSAYPAQPVNSIIKDFSKFDQLPNLYAELLDAGYSTSFFSGGSLQFDNIEGYLKSGGVQQLVGEKDFSINRRTHWGAYDDETFSMHLKALGNLPQPFCSGITTMTTHEEFEADLPKRFTTENNRINNAYRNSMYYADSCLFAYIKGAQKEPWYANTLFVIIADHGCRFPKMRDNYEVERHHIPFLLIGGAMKDTYKGKQYSRITSQLDIAKTLLYQLGLSAAKFPRSKNVFNSNEPAFAYYTFDNGFGILTQNKIVIYDNIRKVDLLGHKQNDTLGILWENYGKAYLQTNFQENIQLSQQK